MYLVIRPWRLQPEAQRNVNKKCDPVALYQKYQQEWKQVSFPGEAKHSKVRWAVREKMLGADPHPMVRFTIIISMIVNSKDMFFLFRFEIILRFF